MGEPKRVNRDSNAILTPYPCDRGTGTPIGYHSFQGNPLGVIVCVYCGVKPKPQR